jgi:hypothetical protein
MADSRLPHGEGESRRVNSNSESVPYGANKLFLASSSLPMT